VKKLLDHFSVAIVDDDESPCRSLCRLLRAAGLNPVTYPSAEWRAQAIAAGCAAYFRKTDPGAAVLDAICRSATRNPELE